MTQPAATAVFSTYELLEQILLQLPFNDLFTVQRVSTAWQDIIKKSTSHRKSMFLLPTATPLISNITGPNTPRYADALELNPILATTIYSHHDDHRSPHQDRRSNITLSRCHIGQCPQLDTFLVTIFPHELVQRQGSWRQTFFTQPPVTELWFYERRGTSRPIQTFVQAADGITWQHLFEVAAREICRRTNGDENIRKPARARFRLVLPRDTHPHLHDALKNCDKRRGEDSKCECLKAFSEI